MKLEFSEKEKSAISTLLIVFVTLVTFITSIFLVVQNALQEIEDDRAMACDICYDIRENEMKNRKL